MLFQSDFESDDCKGGVMLTKRTFLSSAAGVLIAAAAGKPDPAPAATPRPGFLRAKDIAEAGFIYGLPIVMIYGIMYEYAIDKASGQYKAPFNTLFNEARVYTYEDRTVISPNSDTPYSFVWMDLRAEPMVVSVPAVDPKRYYALMLTDLNTYNFGYVGSRATGSGPGSYMVVGPDWTGPTQAGILGNDAVEAMYPMTKVDAAGQPLDCSKSNYTLTFAAGQLPPVHAFWSVTLYDDKTQLLVKNPVDRYLINSPMLPGLKKNADGSLTIYIQNKSPGPDKESNWLPASDGPINLIMRLYWPKTTQPSILPPGEGTWLPPGVKRAA